VQACPRQAHLPSGWAEAITFHTEWELHLEFQHCLAQNPVNKWGMLPINIEMPDWYWPESGLHLNICCRYRAVSGLINFLHIRLLSSQCWQPASDRYWPSIGQMPACQHLGKLLLARCNYALMDGGYIRCQRDTSMMLGTVKPASTATSWYQPSISMFIGTVCGSLWDQFNWKLSVYISPIPDMKFYHWPSNVAFVENNVAIGTQ